MTLFDVLCSAAGQVSRAKSRGYASGSRNPLEVVPVGILIRLARETESRNASVL